MEKVFDIQLEWFPEQYQEQAKNELRETPEVKEKAIVELRRLLSETKDLYYADDDDFLVVFLRPTKFYPESALKLMRSIAEFRKNYADLVYNLMPENLISQFVDNDVVNILPNRDQKGRRVMLVNCGSIWDPKAVTNDQMFQLFYLVHLIAQLEPSTQVSGVVCIMDFDGLGMKQISALTPAGSKRLLTFIQEAMPLRMKEVHFVKQPFIFNMVWKLFKPFVQEKLNKRMFFHGKDMKALHKFLDPAVLPANYGGTLPAIDYTGKDWYPCVNNYKDHIERWGLYGYTDLKNKYQKA
jgi:retinaldehyde-binding protein 1